MSARRRVVVAMSGGVDSGVAAALLTEQGHEVIGVTLQLWCYGRAPGPRAAGGAEPVEWRPGGAEPRACCSLEAIEQARDVARRLGIPHYVIGAEDAFRRHVLQPFLDEYAAGRTPYPCALCNRHLKFGDLLARLESLGAERLATGHYARLEPGADGTAALLRAADPAKDQSYALALTPRQALPRLWFPLGSLTKEEVRAHARRLGLPVWDRPESQDLCFAPDGDYAGFITGRLGETRGTLPGPFEDESGRRLGTHRGILHYTVGQRHGLGLAAPEPLYVLAVDAARNVVVVGPRAALAVPELLTEPVHWLTAEPARDGASARVKIRYNHAGAAASLHPRADGSCEVRFAEPQAAVAPGQLAVFYEGERVLGGAPIARGRSAPHAGGCSSRAATATATR